MNNGRSCISQLNVARCILVLWENGSARKSKRMQIWTTRHNSSVSIVTRLWAGRQGIWSRKGFRFLSPTHRPGRLWAHHSMQTYGEEGVWSHSFVTSVVDRGEWEASCPRGLYTWGRRLNGPQSRTGHTGEERHILFQTGIESPRLVSLTWTDMKQNYFF